MKLYKAEELAELLQIHPRTVYRLGREGKLKRVKVGRSVRFYEPTAERKVRNDSKAVSGTNALRMERG